MDTLFKSILKSEKLIFNNTYQSEALTGFYSIGICSSPTSLTTLSQQFRGILLADSIFNSLRLNHSLKSKPFRITIIGGGVSGISFALRLLELKNKTDLNIRITLLEKGPYLMPIQRGCMTREISPLVHTWPSHESIKENINISHLLERFYETNLTNFANWEFNKAAHVCDRFASKIIDFLPSKSIEVYENVSDLRIDEDSSKICLTYTANKITDNLGTKGDLNYLPNNKADVVVFATGFGIEKTIEKFHNGSNELKNIGNSYWRNDHFGQTLLYKKNNNFLVSGIGDGALNDILRLKILNYSPEKTIKLITNFSTLDVKSKIAFSEIIKELEKIKNENSDLISFFEKKKKEKNMKNFINHIQAKLTPLLIEDIKIIILMNKDINDKSTNLSLIVNNKNAFFYNRFLFYFVWRKSRFIEFDTISTKIETYDQLKPYIIKHDINEDNIIIRHGADKFKPLRDIFVQSGINNFNDCQSIYQERREMILSNFKDFLAYLDFSTYLNGRKNTTLNKTLCGESKSILSIKKKIKAA